MKISPLEATTLAAVRRGEWSPDYSDSTENAFLVSESADQEPGAQ